MDRRGFIRKAGIAAAAVPALGITRHCPINAGTQMAHDLKLSQGA